MPRKIRMILDVDTGIDDALAVMLAVKRPGIALEAVTTVYGNIDVTAATRNTLQILEVAGAPDIPVAVGAARALTRPFMRKASHIHGPNGIGEVVLPPPSRVPVAEAAADLIIRLARENPGAITLVPVGPMTNVALALMKAPETARLLDRIVLMGGSLNHPGVPGIPSPMADANFFNDPEAARIVFQSGARVTMVGMDVTMKTLFTGAMMDDLAARGDAGTRAVVQASRYYLAAYQAQYPDITGCALHDPLAVAVAEEPGLVTTERMQCDVECAGEITRGQVVADRRRTGKTVPNVDVCIDVDVPRFMDLFLTTLAG
jgi:purine nucleosidase